MTEPTEKPSVVNQYSLQPETRLTMHNLIMRTEDGDYIIGRMETGEFIALPEVGHIVVDLFQKNNSLQEIKGYLWQEYELDFDVETFVENLIELDFVKAIDGQPVESGVEQKVTFPWLQSYHVQWLFSKPIKFLYVLLLMAAGLTIITRPELVPNYNDFFWSTRGSIVIFLNTILFITNLTLHELAHLAAARSLGVSAYVNLGTRLHDLVLQTNVTGLWAIPRNKRYRVYLAGIAWDLIPISVAILLLAHADIPLVVRNILSTLILLNFFGVIWQFQFYMRTDIYFVVLSLMRCYSLFDDSLAYLRYLFNLIKRSLFSKQSEDPTENPLKYLSPRDQWKVKSYTILMILGSSISLAIFFAYGIPILVILFIEAFHSVQQGIDQSQTMLVLDGLVVILVEGTFQLVFVVTFLKNRRKRLSQIWSQVIHLGAK